MAATLLALVLAQAIDPNALVVPPDAPELRANPELRGRLEEGPHAYFRGIGLRFMALLCQRFAERLASEPAVTLHGDAHLEQYAVTDDGRGLTDFDDSTTGPPLLDLARFATSIQLALRERGFSGAEALIPELVRGYRRGIEDPHHVGPEPALARQLRARFDQGRAACLGRAENLMFPLPPEELPSQETLARLASLLGESAGLPSSFFAVKKLGALRVGIGSAGDEKYLLRIEGRSPSPGDDVILEVKEVRRLPALSCLRAEPGPTRILVAQAHLAYEPFSYVGGFSLEGRPFWFHAWPDNYAELSVAGLASAASLREVVYDVGVQLGRGHGKPVRGEKADALRQQLLALLPTLELLPLSAALADASEEAWRRFQDRAPIEGR